MLVQPARAQEPTVEDLMRKIDALQHRVDQLEGALSASKRPVAPHTVTAGGASKARVGKPQMAGTSMPPAAASARGSEFPATAPSPRLAAASSGLPPAGTTQ